MAGRRQPGVLVRVSPAVLGALILIGPERVAAQPGPPSPRARPAITYTVPPGTPLIELLPAAPAVRKVLGPVLAEDVARVPSVTFTPPVTAKRPQSMADLAHRQIGTQVVKIHYANKDRLDGFMETLVHHRPDLAGLPVVMGGMCRMPAARIGPFQTALGTIRNAQASSGLGGFGGLGGLGGSIGGIGGIGGMMGMGGNTGGNFGGGSGIMGFGGVATGGFGSMTGAPGIIANGSNGFAGGIGFIKADPGAAFWSQVPVSMPHRSPDPKTDQRARDDEAQASIAAFTQVLAPASASHRQGLVKYLSGIAHVEATRAIARLALYSPEAEVQETAIEYLKLRREKDYTPVFVQGLRYPWPLVVKRAADALVKLESRAAIPQLIDALEAGDPRLPQRKQIDGKEVNVVREVVKINHHQNCLLCHAPARRGDRVKSERGGLPVDVVDAPVGAIPLPGEPLSSPSFGYQPQPQDLIVRVDVTYLRQDFSMMLPVARAAPWPIMQRFDFLVCTRVVSDEDAAIYRDALTPREPEAVTAYASAMRAALRALSGRDAEPTAAAWRESLGQRNRDK